MHFLQAINSDLSVLIVCNKTGGTIKEDIKKKDIVIWSLIFSSSITRITPEIITAVFSNISHSYLLLYITSS